VVFTLEWIREEWSGVEWVTHCGQTWDKRHIVIISLVGASKVK